MKLGTLHHYAMEPRDKAFIVQGYMPLGHCFDNKWNSVIFAQNDLRNFVLQLSIDPARAKSEDLEVHTPDNISGILSTECAQGNIRIFRKEDKDENPIIAENYIRYEIWGREDLIQSDHFARRFGKRFF